MQTKFMERAVFGAAALLLAAAAQAAGVPEQGTWESSLKERDIGGAAVAADSSTAVFLYDTTLNVTNPDGTVSWDGANTWVNTLTVGACSGWRLAAGGWRR